MKENLTVGSMKNMRLEADEEDRGRKSDRESRKLKVDHFFSDH